MMMLSANAEQPRRSGIEWLPWSALNSGQRAARLAIYLVLALILFAATHDVLSTFRTAGEHLAPAEHAPTTVIPNAPLIDAERNTGIEALCKVFQIYQIPKTPRDADEAVGNAAELFKLGGDPPPGRSMQILKVIAHQFLAGELTAADCAAAGQVLPTQATRAQ